MLASILLRLCALAIFAGCVGASLQVQADGIDPAYDSFLARKAYDVPTKPGLGPAGYNLGNFHAGNHQPGAVLLGSVGAKPPPPDQADPRYNFIPSKDYGQGAGINIRVSF
ncbi:hypothetical protein [Rhodoligotrophos defluvii]|uniref:hypothetical protein n=1 Tax=Rhodoligotrophos defluvii TaxID=2561934 RepID=UPI0010C9BA2F|nr:hypothetical protein [Rhodoligotrophos defluvii]